MRFVPSPKRKKLTKTPPINPNQSVGSLAALINSLNHLKDEMIDATVDQLEKIDSYYEKVDEKVAELQAAVSEVKELHKGDPGVDADEEKIASYVLSQIRQPKDGVSPSVEEITQEVLTRIPKVNEKAIIKEISEKIPKASLKVIQEKIEIDPIIDKILKDDRFKVFQETGIEQTKQALRSQIRQDIGYVHGGGDTVGAGSGITITNVGGVKVISSAAGGGTVTQVSTGTGLTGGPINTTGTVQLATNIAPIATLGTPGQLIRVNAGGTALEYFTTSSGGVSSVVGTSNRISVDSTDPANPIVNIAATYIGQNTITTLGTITTGVWNGTAITNANLANSTITIGSTSIALGATSTTLAGLTSVTSTSFTGALTGNASTVTTNANLTGDVTSVGNATTLATVNSNVGTFGSATQSVSVTVNGKGLITTISNVTVTPAVGSITGLGTGVATALAVNIGSAGAFITFNGALGTPSSGVATNITGLPAASVLAGTFGSGAYTMNTNLTVPQIFTTSNAVTAVANATTLTRTNRINTVTNNSAATLTITLSTASALDGDLIQVRILDFSGVAQTVTWVNTENSTATAPVTSNGSTTLPLTVGFQYNNATSKWRCIASA